MLSFFMIFSREKQQKYRGFRKDCESRLTVIPSLPEMTPGIKPRSGLIKHQSPPAALITVLSPTLLDEDRPIPVVTELAREDFTPGLILFRRSF
jgi:hypothetical protein